MKTRLKYSSMINNNIPHLGEYGYVPDDSSRQSKSEDLPKNKVEVKKNTSDMPQAKVEKHSLKEEVVSEGKSEQSSENSKSKQKSKEKNKTEETNYLGFVLGGIGLLLLGVGVYYFFFRKKETVQQPNAVVPTVQNNNIQQPNRFLFHNQINMNPLLKIQNPNWQNPNQRKMF